VETLGQQLPDRLCLCPVARLLKPLQWTEQAAPVLEGLRAFQRHYGLPGHDLAHFVRLFAIRLVAAPPRAARPVYWDFGVGVVFSGSLARRHRAPPLLAGR
tara:strand:- start:7944 stop:8246 length:303 start_codon:yes stop_codon:yes gene_type:complete